MNYDEKFYCSRDPDESEIIIIKNLLKKINLGSHLNENFIYILLEEEDNGLEILSFENDLIYIASKELNVSNKMAIEYLIEKIEIDQAYNKLLYETDIEDYKKYKTVTDEKLTRKGIKKQYSDYVIYAHDKREVSQILNKTGVFDYLYIENVSQKKKKTDNET
tara:strand:- start:123 stop:611 length:489 start_codon:yes stop_codon:yes gene_type:complete